MTLKIFVNLTMTLKICIKLIITLKMFINFIGNIFYARKRNSIVCIYIVNVKILLTSYVHLETLYLKICNSSENVSSGMFWKIRLFLFFLLISCICTSIRISFDFLIYIYIYNKNYNFIFRTYWHHDLPQRKFVCMWRLHGNKLRYNS